MKKGYTLIELVGVIVLLAALLLIVLPVVNKSLKEGKQKSLEGQITMIEQSLATFSLENKPNDGEVIYLTLSQLKQAGLVEFDIKDPVTKQLFPNDMELTITNTDGIITYSVLTDTGSCKRNYKDVPKIDLSGNNIVYVEINTSYSDILPMATDKAGIELNNLTSEGSVDVTKLGNYYIKYFANKDGYCNASIRTVIVRDTIGPVIKYNGDLTINMSQIDDYDFLSDVSITDNSKQDATIVVEKDFSAIPGSYQVKYIATDPSGNQTVSLRKVVVK